MSSNPLPFRERGALQEQGGAQVMALGDPALVPVSVWPAAGTDGAAGRHWDHEGEAPLDWADELQVTNRQLVVDGTTYKIVQAVEHPFFPHVALRLVESKP